MTRLALAAILVLPLALVGCGDGGDAPQSAPARAYADAVRRLKGETVAMTVPSEKRSLLGKLFTRRAA